SDLCWCVWVCVAASGGEDIDADGNGAVDTAPTANKGTLHALARASDWRTKHIRITPLSEIAWQYVENMIPAVSAEEVKIRLADLARYLIKADISGNGTIDWDDILAFDPANAAHRDKLAFDYTWLTKANDAGQTILASLQAGEKDAVLAQLDATFSWLMTRFPVPDSRYKSVKLSLAVFGSGSITSSNPLVKSIGSTLVEPVQEQQYYLAENAFDTVTLTASPAEGYQVLGWSGCEAVSADLSQCTVTMDKSHSVEANFGSTETQFTGMVHDLSNTYNIVGMSTISVLIPGDMAELIAEMAAANVDEFVVGDDGGGFLRRITAINQISSTYYQLETVEASLDEVIAQGTGHMFKQMTNGDLEGYTESAALGQQAMVAQTAFVGLEGASLKVSDQSDDTTFTIMLGEQSSADALGTQAASNFPTIKVELFKDDDTGTSLSASGQIDLDISLDTGFDFGWFAELEYFKFIVKVDAKQTVELTASGELKRFDFVEKKIGTLKFAPILVQVGVLPVWVTPQVDVFLFAEGSIKAEAKFGMTFSQKAEGGILYNKNKGFSSHRKFTFDKKVNPPTIGLNASLQGGLKASPGLLIYSAIGPVMPLKAYVELAASGSTVIYNTCQDVIVKLSAGFDAKFQWDLSGKTKLGTIGYIDQLEEKTKFSVFNVEWPLKEWTVHNNCPDQMEGPFLSVDGEGIFSTIDLGDPNGLATTLTVSNTGEEDLHWNTTKGSDAITISPSSGVLAPGAEELVQMSVATADLPVGRYLRKPFFYNEASLGQDLPDEEFGNTRKTVDIIVNDTGVTDTPEIISAVSSEPGEVVLDWELTPSGTYPLLGFAIYATEAKTDSGSYKSVYTTNSYERQAIISGLKPSATYSFKMRVYGNQHPPFGPYSNVVSAQVAGNPPSFIPTALNDTGITWSGNYKSGNNTVCVASTTPDGDNVVAAQDCSHGRDTTHNDDSDGHAGFSYTKLDNNGVPLTNQNADYATTPWACVRDNVTGLIWEVKTDDGGLHDKDDTYMWYNTNPATNGGEDGADGAVNDTCSGWINGDAASYCNTEAYVNRVNTISLCGASDWRMPTRKELVGILHYGIFSPAIGSGYFPNTVSFYVWSGSPTAEGSAYAWYVNFSDGTSITTGRYGQCAVRLVRGGQ
ncbi:MAG: DUF1566 domain-containing protein, partial [Candidatus Electrothrix sp. AS4_5]|nr:DUF1566 domain-containing protein [Candidatus Electrothrix gigas]